MEDLYRDEGHRRIKENGRKEEKEKRKRCELEFNIIQARPLKQLRTTDRHS